MPFIRPALLLVAALMLGGCSVWGSEEDTAAKEVAAEITPVRVMQVRNIEIGRTRDGFLITAHGMAAGPGYSRPTLRPRHGGAPGPDGYIEFDLVATPPPPGLALPPASAQELRLRADLPVDTATLRGAAGVRVMAAEGGVQLDFRPPSSSDKAPSSEKAS